MGANPSLTCMQTPKECTNRTIFSFFTVMLRLKVMQIFVILIVFAISIGKCFWVTDLSNNLNQTRALTSVTNDLFEEARKKKRKDNLLKVLLVGAILAKMIIFPAIVKAMAVMSTVAVLLSSMSLIMSSIVGYAKLATRRRPESTIRYVHVNEAWAKGDKGLPNDYIYSDSFEQVSSLPLEQTNMMK